MEEKVYDIDILHAKICPYCGKATEYIDSKEFYGKSYGMVYACIPCQAWVRVHKGTDIALGRLANEELREWKKQTHALFDPLWKKLLSHGISIAKARKACYSWLSNRLSIPFEYTHVGMFDVDQCRNACEAIKALLENEGLQAILPHDENIQIIHPLNRNTSVDMDQLSTYGKDKYLRDVYDELVDFAERHGVGCDCHATHAIQDLQSIRHFRYLSSQQEIS